MKPLPIATALVSAALFGASTPAAKVLAGDLHPVMLAGLLYAGSGVGLSAWLVVRPGQRIDFSRADWLWLAGAIACGGVGGPILLMMGLAHTSAADASLLLNLEGVFTALLAWFVFRENFDRRIALGMGFIVAGGVLLALAPGTASAWQPGSFAIVAACAAWALDNNLTRKVSGGNPVAIAAVKGLAAGAVSLSIAQSAGAAWPSAWQIGAASAVGLLGYGVSLVLFVLALRDLGAARTGAYFSSAPFVGVAIAIAALGESPGAWFWPAAALVAAGVWLHVSERHEHEHVHEPMEHEHRHAHDEHHRHPHGSDWDGSEPHSHRHRHERLAHRHPHYPDLHHRHH